MNFVIFFSFVENFGTGDTENTEVGAVCIYNNNNNNDNNDQSNLAKGGIAVGNPPNSSFVLARWQHRTDGLAAICNFVFWLGVKPLNLSFPCDR